MKRQMKFLFLFAFFLFVHPFVTRAAENPVLAQIRLDLEQNGQSDLVRVKLYGKKQGQSYLSLEVVFHDGRTASFDRAVPLDITEYPYDSVGSTNRPALKDLGKGKFELSFHFINEIGNWAGDIRGIDHNVKLEVQQKDGRLMVSRYEDDYSGETGQDDACDAKGNNKIDFEARTAEFELGENGCEKESVQKVKLPASCQLSLSSLALPQLPDCVGDTSGSDEHKNGKKAAR